MRRLAAELRRLREAAGLSQEDVTAQTGVNVATLYRIETGRTKPQLRTLQALLTAYGVTGADRDALVLLQKDAGKRGWLHTSDSDLTEQYTAYINFEAEAREILNFETIFVPGLLQTPDYAREVISGVLPTATEEQVQRRVDARLNRQLLLTVPDSPHLWAVIDEAALHRRVGGPSVMRDQLRHLATQARNPQITIQVVPFKAGAHPGMPGSFIILRFGAIGPDIVYIDSMGGDLFLEEEAELIRHNMVFEHLRAVALSPSDTAALLTSLSEDLD
ncbi:helix-turn-helix domain-containing protein [Nonomuraea basaltis]|uniref:helix-turn-helix domain-containing protein n=1 Tax=Nonomuraea basaltis TaxID=2495887 RepID=UPI00110C56B2|nr:helix-turn-helix transcriptional regulator [Nonomuraea basaltis]TMR99778.1 helix-turn-helix domain-containing protein [Nonomuraea basaltis]